MGAVGELPRSEVENFEGWSLGSSSSCWLCPQSPRCSSSRQVTSFKVEQVCPSCTPVSPIHTSSRRSLVRGQTHLCTPSPLPPPSSCLHHQGPLLQQPPLGLSHPSLWARKPALKAIFSSPGYFGCAEFIKSLRRAIFERGGGRVSKIVLEDENSGGRQGGTCSNSSSSSSCPTCSTRPPLSLPSSAPPASLPSSVFFLRGANTNTNVFANTNTGCRLAPGEAQLQMQPPILLAISRL